MTSPIAFLGPLLALSLAVAGCASAPDAAEEAPDAAEEAGGAPTSDVVSRDGFTYGYALTARRIVGECAARDDAFGPALQRHRLYERRARERLRTSLGAPVSSLGIDDEAEELRDIRGRLDALGAPELTVVCRRIAQEQLTKLAEADPDAEPDA